MPRLVAEKLSPAFVNHAKRGKIAPGMYADGGGLYLYVGASSAAALARGDPHTRGAVSWIFRYMRDRRAHEMGLGSLQTIGLAEARQRATERRRELLGGGDPLQLRQAGRQQAQLDAARAMSFRQCAERFIALHKATWKNPAHAAQWPATLEAYVYPVCGALPVRAIDTGLVMRVLEPIWTVKAETASRVRGRIETVLDWATVSGYRQGDNPARWRGHLDKLLPAPAKAKRVARQALGREEHHMALPYSEIAAFLSELRQQSGSAPRALEFAILTASRTGEVIGASWAEFDLAARLWTIPADRMKSGREHRVPLSDGAMRVLAELGDRRAGGAYLFPGARPGKPLSNMALLMTLRRMGRGDVTVHGFRSTFRDWAAEATNFPAEVAEMALAHAVGDKAEAAYRRSDLFDKRRQLADSWADFCEAPASVGNAAA
jgi:integrase